MDAAASSEPRLEPGRRCDGDGSGQCERGRRRRGGDPETARSAVRASAPSPRVCPRTRASTPPRATALRHDAFDSPMSWIGRCRRQRPPPHRHGQPGRRFGRWMQATMATSRTTPRRRRRNRHSLEQVHSLCFWPIIPHRKRRYRERLPTARPCRNVPKLIVQGTPLGSGSGVPYAGFTLEARPLRRPSTTLYQQLVVLFGLNHSGHRYDPLVVFHPHQAHTLGRPTLRFTDG